MPETQATNDQTSEILHGLLGLLALAISIFVKNPNSQKHAASLLNTANNVVLPIIDKHITEMNAADAQAKLPLTS